MLPFLLVLPEDLTLCLQLWGVGIGEQTWGRKRPAQSSVFTARGRPHSKPDSSASPTPHLALVTSPAPSVCSVRNAQNPSCASPRLLEICLSPNFSHTTLASLLISLGLSRPLHKTEVSLGNTDPGDIIKTLPARELLCSRFLIQSHSPEMHQGFKKES